MTSGAGSTDSGEPIDVSAVLGPERRSLVELLQTLDPSDWSRPTACPAWTVHELAVHLVHDDVRRLSAGRDGHTGSWIDASTLDDLAAGLDETNERWVATVSPTLSPRLAWETLEWLGVASEGHLRSLEPERLGNSVLWAGAGPRPNWLDVAREYTERWVHQQQIRDAVGRPGLLEPEFLAPVIDTFAWALPASLPQRPVDAEVVVTVTGSVARNWSLRSTGRGWTLVSSVGRSSGGRPDAGSGAGSDGSGARSGARAGGGSGARAGGSGFGAAATIDLPVEAYWRRAVRLLDRHEVRSAARVSGDPALTDAVLDVRAAIVVDSPSP